MKLEDSQSDGADDVETGDYGFDHKKGGRDGGDGGSTGAKAAVVGGGAAMMAERRAELSRKNA